MKYLTCYWLPVSLRAAFRQMVISRRASLKEERQIVTRVRAVDMVRSGKTRRAVAKELGVSVGFVGYWFRRAGAHKRYADAKRSGRPTTFTRSTTRRAVALAYTKTHGTVRRITQKLHGEGTALSKSTVHRMLRRTSRRFYRRAKKPKLTAAHRAMRLAWATQMLNQPMQVINRMVFADEKRFAVGGESVGVWRLPEEARPVREAGKSSSARSGCHSSHCIPTPYAAFCN